MLVRVPIMSEALVRCFSRNFKIMDYTNLNLQIKNISEKYKF